MVTNMISGKKVLVTGGCGFIGSHLSEKLIELGNNVTVIDNLSITDRNVEFLKGKGVNVLVGDITDYDFLLKHVREVDVVFHLAAMNRAIKSINEPRKANEVNISGTLNVFEACRKNSVPRIVNVSSSSVYGSSSIFPRKEGNEVKPTHPYAIGKLTGEHYANVFNELYDIKTTNLRYFSVYGPRQLGTIEHAAVIPKFIYKILNNEEIRIYGDGEQKRNFTYVTDTVDATIKAASLDSAIGETFNVATEEEISVNKMVSLVSSILGKEANVIHDPEVKGEIRANPADISKSKELLGYSPMVNAEEGIKNVVEWYKNEF